MATLLRSLPWRPFGVVAAVAVVTVVARPDVPTLRLAALLLAAGAALFCDDPAETVTDATPTCRAVRRGGRWAVGSAAAYAVWLALLPFVDGAAVGDLAAELGLALVVALAAGSAFGGVAAAPALAVTLASAQYAARYVSHPRTLAFVLGVAVLGAALLDPARRRGRAWRGA